MGILFSELRYMILLRIPGARQHSEPRHKVMTALETAVAQCSLSPEPGARATFVPPASSGLVRETTARCRGQVAPAFRAEEYCRDRKRPDLTSTVKAAPCDNSPAT